MPADSGDVLPDSGTLLMHAIVLRAAGHPDLALRKCLAAITVDASEENLLLAAELHMETCDASSAYELLRDVRHRHTDSLSMSQALAETCMAIGRYEEAIRILREALALEPASFRTLVQLSSLLCNAGDSDSAQDVWDNAIAASTDDAEFSLRAAMVFGHFGRLGLAGKYIQQADVLQPDDPEIAYLLAAIEGTNIPDRAPVNYLHRMFENFAAHYDFVLKSLCNAGPDLIGKAMASIDLPTDNSLNILDAGCGTGLCGPLLRPYARRLLGIDLSESMLEQARNRGCYDELRCGDMLVPTQLDQERFDLVVCSDVLVYFGALDAVFAAFAAAMRSNGRLIITLEKLTDEDNTAPYRLAVSGRYQHRFDYVQEMLRVAGFEEVYVSSSEVLRHECGDPVTCHNIVACRLPR